LLYFDGIASFADSNIQGNVPVFFLLRQKQTAVVKLNF